MNRNHKLLLYGVIVVSMVMSIAWGASTASAFPGDKRDEECADLIAQAIAATPEGETADIPDDCLPDEGMSAIEVRAAEAVMRVSPLPDVNQVPYQEDVVWTRAYRRMIGHVVIYDAPNGNPIGELDAGYNYVTVISAQDGFIQINYGQWVAEEHITWADVSEFAGVEIVNQPKRPFAWMLAEAYPSRYPGGPQDKNAQMIERYALMNIYGVEYVDGWEWYLVGPNQWIQQIRVAKVQPTERPEGVSKDDWWVSVDLYEQTAVAYEGDKMVFATLISSGLPQWGTREGLYQIYDRFEATRMSGASGQTDFYFIEEVPYVMYYDGEIALHGTYWHDRFGYRQSHGCVNLSIMDSWWLFDWTSSEPDINVWVYVHSSGKYRTDLPSWARR
ncbi:MAG: L,D-transpeptidase [Anaerolineae bacterium]|nr:L,D-transpeptidase [Anaerolineae bacterium]